MTCSGLLHFPASTWWSGMASSSSSLSFYMAMRRRFYNSKINIRNAPKAPKQLQRRISDRGQTIIMDDEEGREKSEGWNRPSACLSFSYHGPVRLSRLPLDVNIPSDILANDTPAIPTSLQLGLYLYEHYHDRGLLDTARSRPPTQQVRQFGTVPALATLAQSGIMVATGADLSA